MANRKAGSLDYAAQRGFDALAPAYSALEPPKRSGETDRFIRWARPKPQGLVLDLATGPALLAKSLARFSKLVLAFDMSEAMLDSGRKQGGLPRNTLLVRGEAERLPFADVTFDLITCAYSFANFRRPARVLREAARVLVPCGRIALLEVVAPEDRLQRARLNQLERLRSPFFTRIRSYRQYVTLCLRAGLEMESSELHFSLQRTSDWIRSSPQAAKPAQSVRLQQMLSRVLGNNEAGMCTDPKHADRFYYQTAWLLFRRLPATTWLRRRLRAEGPG